MIESEGGCEKEIRRRVTLGGAVTQAMGKIWKNKNMSKLTKTITIKAMVFPVVLYGWETRTMTKATKRKIDACEMWIWKRMLRVAWTESITNESILQELGEVRGDLSLLQRATRQTMMFFGHVMRADGL